MKLVCIVIKYTRIRQFTVNLTHWNPKIFKYLLLYCNDSTKTNLLYYVFHGFCLLNSEYDHVNAIFTTFVTRIVTETSQHA